MAYKKGETYLPLSSFLVRVSSLRQQSSLVLPWTDLKETFLRQLVTYNPRRDRHIAVVRVLAYPNDSEG